MPLIADGHYRINKKRRPKSPSLLIETVVIKPLPGILPYHQTGKAKSQHLTTSQSSSNCKSHIASDLRSNAVALTKVGKQTACPHDAHNVTDITEWQKAVTLWNTRIKQLIRNRLRGHIEVISQRFAKQSGLPAEQISPLIRRPGTTVLQDSCIYSEAAKPC